MAQAEYFFQESCRIFEQLDEPICLAAALGNQEALLNISGQFAELLELRKRQLATAEQRGNRMAILEMHMFVGETYHMLGRYEEAESHGRLAVELARETAFEFDVAWARWFLGLTLLGAGKVAEARGVFQECLLVFQEGGKAGFVGRTLAGLSRAELALGNRTKAWKHALHSLALNDEVPDFISLLYTLATMALLLIDIGEMERAVEVYGLVSRYAFVANSVWFEHVFGQHVEGGAALLSPEVEEAARERGARSDPWQLAKELLEEGETLF
jgi:tetratricopeptide (TPR) repeat protein